MQPIQPSEAPQAPVAQATPEDGTIQQVADGQQMIIYAILIYFATTVLIRMMGPIAGVLAVAAVVLGFIGVLQLAKGLGMPMGTRVLLGFLILVPVVSLLTLLVLNSRATSRLRAAGYTVGFFGASK
jgi:hypothetical protein